jgi:uncharacterized membrane protein YdbT with pleckstrin-like domain
MSEIHYDAHPSLFRMRPFATILAMLLLAGGILIAVVGNRFLPPVIAGQIDGKSLQVIGIAVFAFATLQLLIWWLSTRSDHLAITDDELLWTHGLLSKQYTEINLASVRSVRVSQSLMQRMMDAGDITIFTAGDSPELMVRGMPEPARIRELVKSQSA